MSASSTKTEWRIDHLDARLVFYSTDALQNERILLEIALPDDDHLCAVACWVGEHRNLWGEWREVSEQQGAEALSRHFDALLKSAAPLSPLTAAALVQGTDEQSLKLVLLMGDAERQIVVRQHRFANLEAATAFKRWYRVSVLSDAFQNLCISGLLASQEVLARRIDQVAEEQTASDEATVK